MKDIITGIQHVGIPTENMEETRKFYKKLGFKIAFETVNDNAEVVFFRLGNLIMETYVVDQAAKTYGSIEHIAVNVKDIGETYERIKKEQLNTLNDTIHFLPFWEHGVRFFTIEGPNKEKIEFSQIL